MATAKRDVPALLALQNAEGADQYQLGAHWARHGDEQGKGPQSDKYLFLDVTRLLEEGHFHAVQSARFPHPGFYLGMVHGAVLDPQTCELRPDATTLVTLSDPYVTRGYRPGRVWFFYEAEANEHRLTDTSLKQRLDALATESHEYMDAKGTINSALGCILGELNGQLLPMTQEEHERIQEEDRQFSAKPEARRAGANQEHDTEPLPMTVLQEAYKKRCVDAGNGQCWLVPLIREA
jgi:hypothetical protein